MINGAVTYNDGYGHEPVEVLAVSDTSTRIRLKNGEVKEVGIHSLKGPGVKEIRAMKKSARDMRRLFGF